jgi:hypothetical protein
LLQCSYDIGGCPAFITSFRPGIHLFLLQTELIDSRQQAVQHILMLCNLPYVIATGAYIQNAICIADIYGPKIRRDCFQSAGLAMPVRKFHSPSEIGKIKRLQPGTPAISSIH